MAFLNIILYGDGMVTLKSRAYGRAVAKGRLNRVDVVVGETEPLAYGVDFVNLAFVMSLAMSGFGV